MFQEFESPVHHEQSQDVYEREQSYVQFPYHAYDSRSALLWTQWVQSGSISDKTLHVIHSVSEGEKPLRWLVNLVDVAELVEGLQDHGIEPPERVRLMGLIHTNAAANNGNGIHVESALQQAAALRRLAEGYLEAFHPTVFVDFEFDFDTPEIVPELISTGKELFPRLPEHVKQTLSRMAEKYNKNPKIKNDVFGAAYLLAHNGAYRRFTEPFGPFQSDENGIFALPQSERVFVDMLRESDEAVNSLGLQTKKTPQNVFFLSKRNRTSHYYAVDHVDPTLESLVRGEPWPDADSVVKGKSFTRARLEAASGIRTIENDIRERGGTPRLIEVIRDAHIQAI